MTIRAERRVPIECAIARGLTDDEIAERLAEDLDAITEVRAYLDEIVLETDGDRETIFAARPVASFPADPAVTADDPTVAAIMGGHVKIPGRNGRRPGPELVEAVRRLAGNGLTDAQIGQRIGRRRDAVVKMRSRYGIRPGVPSTRDGERGLRHLWNSQARACGQRYDPVRGSLAEPSAWIAS